MKYCLWTRSKIVMEWVDTGKMFDSPFAEYERLTDGRDYALLPEGTVPVDGYSSHCNIRVPDGGFLAVIIRSATSREAVERMQKLLNEKIGIKCLVMSGEFSLVGVGPEGK